ncbi:ATP-binding cassette domain-containing protein [Nocardioides sp. dk4132]|uniref:ABC transporter ATP-binding protein n=1 Tax=unclassified Nocardioides TaxID=2615069 RepID=UPI001297C753|nr:MULTISPECIES: ABC transporter ATP-binding protein [unclassified Nocardioides]MQW75268.1 ATP-binding cassette domain-containing protein [Nocardioides sp. dk4132]QGA07581.1 ATP-binding cassette domain-containing protein [Nocardioides sp. dk884]
MTRLLTRDLTTGYAGREILHGVDLEIPDGLMTVIVGPNACGKSTLLRSLARMLAPTGGEVLLDGTAIDRLPPKEVARRLGLLPQSATAPSGMSVADLVARGRYPHQGLWRQWSSEDERAVEDAMRAADVSDLRDRAVDELSGGQRQRVWLALALAQETPLLLLDEPTTYLDIAHQVEVLELARRLRREGRTVVAVLHELHLAFRYAEHLVVMRDGAVVATGDPREVVTAALVEEVYDLPCRIITDPVSGTPIVIPLAGAAR